MRKESQTERLKEMRRLYEVENLSLREIAARFEISWQAIHERLKKAGVNLRVQGKNLRRRQPLFKRQELVRLYIDEELTIEETAKSLKTTDAVISRELERHKIDKRPRGYYLRKLPEIEQLAIGSKVIILRPIVKQPFSALYNKAKNIGIRVSIRSLDNERFEVTRVG